MKNSVSTHFGVYGVSKKKNYLMCIKKNAGPYKNRFDIPGGSQEDFEGLTETLCREFLEETGYSINAYSNPRVYDAFIKEINSTHTVHHIMVFYDVVADTTRIKSLPKVLADGLNDSDGVIWKKLEDLNEDNSSPLILKIKEEVAQENEMEKYENFDWIVNETEIL